MKYDEKACAFTGYRPQKLSFGNDETHEDCLRLKSILKNEICALVENGYNSFLSGMALGIDIICAELVLEIKREAPDIKLVAVIPCLLQERQWGEQEQRRYRSLLARADEKIFVTQTEFTKGCMQKRNRYLAQNSDKLLAVWDGQSGGTMQTIQFAQRCGKPVTVIDPTRFLKIELLTEDSFEQMTFEN